MEDGRDERGRFVPGNQAGKKANGGNGGRPSRATEQELLSILREEVTPDVFRCLVRAWIPRAKKNATDLKLLLAYLVGAPPETLQVTGELKTLVEYVNDWRTWQDPPPCPPSGAAGSEDTGAPLQLAGGGPEVA